MASRPRGKSLKNDGYRRTTQANILSHHKGTLRGLMDHKLTDLLNGAAMSCTIFSFDIYVRCVPRVVHNHGHGDPSVTHSTFLGASQVTVVDPLENEVNPGKYINAVYQLFRRRWCGAAQPDQYIKSTEVKTRGGDVEGRNATGSNAHRNISSNLQYPLGSLIEAVSFGPTSRAHAGSECSKRLELMAMTPENDNSARNVSMQSVTHPGWSEYASDGSGSAETSLSPATVMGCSSTRRHIKASEVKSKRARRPQRGTAGGDDAVQHWGRSG
ncbi:hypothetical protein B0H13DRAFT_1890569 [Mycena leptocephala]|nr:hypothetical protein B0H13DRAFT_1890569 [Mycena leptocephala]